MKTPQPPHVARAAAVKILLDCLFRLGAHVGQSLSEIRRGDYRAGLGRKQGGDGFGDVSIARRGGKSFYGIRLLFLSASAVFCSNVRRGNRRH